MSIIFLVIYSVVCQEILASALAVAAIVLVYIVPPALADYG